ncbi:hypothetical protein ACWDUD_01460 [Rhodococcus sp. NPDC003382]|uniref:hypothetical protein n=1 Tax=Rhodococcus sp. CX TaxID=2789880 RepID=UPI0018CF32DE|nr:hypothetical protein [Rhodococcus sp. CX]MBH0123650.1 hypothetical protein [Rhodococcus sp. CX]
MSDRDELLAAMKAHSMRSWTDGVGSVCACGWEGRLLSAHTVDELLAAGYRRARVITTVQELADMRDGTVIIGPDGLVGEKRDFPLDLAVRYVNGTTETNADIPMPVTVLYTPEESR